MASTSAAPGALDRSFRNLDLASEDLSKDLHTDLVLLKIIAEDLERENDSEKVQALEAATLEILAAADELGRHQQAMQALRVKYAPSDQLTDFQGLIRAEMERTPSVNPKDHAFYKQLREAIWNVHHAGVPMPGQEEAEVCITTQAGVVNKTCPLTGKPVTELEDPVRSKSCRHIYERRAVIEYIGNKRDVVCAAAGCPKKISVNIFVCDPTLHMEIQELRLRGAGRSHGPAPDCTELDDD